MRKVSLNGDIHGVTLVEVSAAGDQLYQWGPRAGDALWLMGRTATPNVRIGDTGTLVYHPKQGGVFGFEPSGHSVSVQARKRS